MQCSERLRASGIPHLAGSPYRLLESRSFIHLEFGTPTENTQKLLNDEVDAALIPVVDFASLGIFRSLEFGMGCRSMSDSMVLYAARPVENLHTIYVYNCSQSSTALLRLLLLERWNSSPRIIRTDSLEPFEYVEGGCGVLGLHSLPGMQRYEYPVQIDLAAEWHAHTGLPFVFLIWAIKRELPVTDSLLKFQKWLHRAAHAAEGISGELADEFDVPAESARTFVGAHRRFYLDEFLLAGMGEFLARASHHRLIKPTIYLPVSKPLLPPDAASTFR